MQRSSNRLNLYCIQPDALRKRVLSVPITLTKHVITARKKVVHSWFLWPLWCNREPPQAHLSTEETCTAPVYAVNDEEKHKLNFSLMANVPPWNDRLNDKWTLKISATRHMTINISLLTTVYAIRMHRTGWKVILGPQIINALCQTERSTYCLRSQTNITYFM